MREIKFKYIFKGSPFSSTDSGFNWHTKVFTLSQIEGGTIRLSGLESALGEVVARVQFTGLTDDSEKGVEAYEGDLIRCQLGCVRVIELIDGSFVGVDPDCDFDELMLSEYCFEVIGNKFQNPELLEQS